MEITITAIIVGGLYGMVAKYLQYRTKAEKRREARLDAEKYDTTYWIVGYDARTNDKGKEVFSPYEQGPFHTEATASRLVAGIKTNNGGVFSVDVRRVPKGSPN